ncbi:adenosylmethionine decarboxylase [Gottfriedia luciferensis]|uniref:adenosylmethionine decarboxylase n=1 Tax=Gottfriedia luciferensis TaxID=178774 RepID=UPI000B43B6AB|nr:adenosylmethionine decarboxylase [Gottfriedia luciferensis]
MNTEGKHLIIDAFECQSDILNDAEGLKKLLTKAIENLGMEIISVHFHSFSPQGVTGVIGISTSHFSIHTWPEERYAALDLYTCGNQELWPTIKDILYKLKARRIQVNELVRGGKLNNSPKLRRLTPITMTVKRGTVQELFQVEDDKGNDWDNIQLKELSNGNHDVLFHGTSQFQDIFLVKANDIRLYLNQELQFSSLDEKYYHEALVFPAMEMAASHKRVLILGGGDGLALREVLKYPNVKHVDLVDIDPLMIQIAKTQPVLLELNNRSFLDKRVNVHNEDAKIFIKGNHEQYDVIIIDFPDPVDSILSSLYTKELFNQVSSLLSKNGALVCQSSSPEDTPIAFWSIARTLEKAGLYTLPYNIVVPSFGLWGFHLATHRKIANNLSKISVPHNALANNLKPLFIIPSNVLSSEKKAIINSLVNLRLHEVYQQEIKKWFK